MLMDYSLYEAYIYEHGHFWFPFNRNLTFGSVNHLGQFVAEYEPDPDLMHKKALGEYNN